VRSPGFLSATGSRRAESGLCSLTASVAMSPIIFASCYWEARPGSGMLGRKPIEIDRASLLRDRARGLSLAQLAKAYKISRTSVARALKRSGDVVPKTPLPLAPTNIEHFA